MAVFLPHALGPLAGQVVVPGSKSETNRALVLAALAEAPSRITGLLDSRDSQLMIGALRTLGTRIEEMGASSVIVTPGPILGGGTVECGLAGTVMRFVPALALLADAPVSFVGDLHASNRPMEGLLDALRALGADVNTNQLPFRVAPSTIRGGEVLVDASASSQFVSALLLVGARLPGGLVVRHVASTVPSRPHIAMTLRMLRAPGVEATELDERTWQVQQGPIAAVDAHIEPDLTNAAAFLAAAAACGGEVRVPGWPSRTDQPGAYFLDVARAMGCEVDVDADAVTLRRTGALRAVETIDLHDASELTPVVAALAALAQGTTCITGVAHIRGHETDRLAALACELHRADVHVEELADGLRITGGMPRATEFATYADHRMVHFAALLGLVAEGSSVTDMDCVSKTMPNFPKLWASLL